MRDSIHAKPKMGRAAALLVKDVPLGPDARLRLQARLEDAGAVIEFRMMRASPADRSNGRFRPTSEGLVLPVAAFKLLQADLQRVGQAAMQAEYWRPYPHEYPAA
jgi:hypothetical protein